MLEDGGDIYYIQTTEGDEYLYDIYRLEVAAGNKHIDKMVKKLQNWY